MQKLSGVGLETESPHWLGGSGWALSCFLKGHLEGISEDSGRHERSKKGVKQAWSTATLKRRPEEEAKKDCQGRRKAGEQATEDAKRTVLRREAPMGSKATKGSSQEHVGFFTGELSKHGFHSSVGAGI